MKVYLAAPCAARDQIARYADELFRIGFTVTSTWLGEKHDIHDGTTGAATDLPTEDVAQHAHNDLVDIGQADLLVLFTAGQCHRIADTGTPSETGSTGGRHIETGYAIALGKPVLVVGQPENVFHRLGRACTVVDDWHEAVIELSALLVADRRPQAVAR